MMLRPVHADKIPTGHVGQQGFLHTVPVKCIAVSCLQFRHKFFQGHALEVPGVGLGFFRRIAHSMPESLHSLFFG